MSLQLPALKREHAVLRRQATKDALLLAAEVNAGKNVDFARRPLSDEEKRAQIDIPAIAKTQEDGYAALTPIAIAYWSDIHEAIASMLFATSDHTTVTDAINRYTQFLSNQSGQLDAATAAFTPDAVKELTTRNDLAGLLVIDEAVRQGKKLDKTVLPPNPVGDVARQTLLLQTGIQTRAFIQAFDLLHTAPPVLNLLDYAENAEKLSTRGIADLANQAVHGAVTQGRNSAADMLEPKEIWASELLDGHTCDRCRTIDGKDYDTMDAARKDYPLAGYLYCEGGPRCRGTLAYIFV